MEIGNLEKANSETEFRLKELERMRAFLPFLLPQFSQCAFPSPAPHICPQELCSTASFIH